MASWLGRRQQIRVCLAALRATPTANQLVIYLILAKQEKLVSNSLTKQLGKNRNLAKLTSACVYMRARIVVAIGVSL
jgi:hypothetical protein